MKRIVKLLLVLSISFACFGCSKVDTTNSDLLLLSEIENIEQNDKLQDLLYFYQTLKEGHKNLFFNVTPEEFVGEIIKIAKLTPEMNEDDFYYSLNYLLSLVGDAHTNIVRFASEDDLLGVDVKFFSDGWYITMINGENREHLSSKLVAVNGMRIDEVSNLFQNIISFENFVWSNYIFETDIRFKTAFQFLNIVGDNEDVIFSLENSEGVISDVVIKTMLQLEESMSVLSYDYKFNHITGEDDTNYHGQKLDENNYFIQYNTCYEDKNLSMKVFAENMKQEISSGNYQNVIIDLRYNSGGYKNVIKPLVKMLDKLQNELEFEVFTLIGTQTFSAGVISIFQIDEKLNSTTVGSLTGGNVNFYGGLEDFELINHEFYGHYSKQYYEGIKDYEGDAYCPNIEIEHNHDNYRKGVDAEIEWILENK